MTIVHQQNGQRHILYHPSVATKFSQESIAEALFNPQWLLTNHKVYRQTSGRGTTYFFNYEEANWVLRHYWRGGLIGKLVKDSYWWQGLEQTRPFRELKLLCQLQKLALPVPSPIAAQVIRSGSGYRYGCSYRGDIITAALPDTHSLVERLAEPLKPALWQAIGKTLARFHQHGVYHDDLNAHNILLDQQGAIFVIDFDKGEIRESTTAADWKKANLERLQRSLMKEKNLRGICFSDSDWNHLLTGYSN